MGTMNLTDYINQPRQSNYPNQWGNSTPQSSGVLQSLLDQYNNGQGTQLNPSQSSQSTVQQTSTQTSQPQQKYQIKDSTGQPIAAMIDTSNLDPNDPQYHQIMAHNTAIANQQKQAQQAQTQQQAPSSLQQVMQGQQQPQQQQNPQMDYIKKQLQDYALGQFQQAQAQPLMAFGQTPQSYNAQVADQQKQAQAAAGTLSGMVTASDVGKAGGATAQQELALQALKNQGANQVASTQFGQSDLEHIGKYYINPKTDAVFNEDGTPASLADSVMAQQAKNQNAKTNKWTDTGVKIMSAPANGLDALDLLSKTLDTYKSSTNQDNNIPLSQVLAKGNQYLTQNGISGNPDMSKLINTAHMTSMALAPLLTDRQSLGMLKQINDVIGQPGMYPISTLENDINNLNTLAKNKYKNSISQYKNANYDTSNFEKDYNNRFNNQTPDTNTTPQGQLTVDMIQMKAPDGSIVPVHSSQLKNALKRGLTQI